MFEQEYKRANDRIHPRKDLLKEMEAKWAAEEAREAKEQAKVVAFPTWARYVSAAAGILLCVGIGMGSVMLFSRGRNTKSEAPMMAEAAVTEEEAKIITKPAAADTAAVESMETEGTTLFETMLGAAAYGSPVGMHLAADEAEVENAIRYGIEDRNEAMTEAAPAAAATEEEQSAQAETPAQQAKGTARSTETGYACGELLYKDDSMAVFMPTTQQVHVIRSENKKLTKTFSLALRERGAQVKRVFWTDSQLLAVQEKNGGTELLRTDVTDWKTPKHLHDLTQSGTFLAAAEMDGRICTLSRYRADEEEPLPWINGERMDYADVLLDDERPGDTFAVLTVYDPAGDDGFVAQTALLADVEGMAAGEDRLLLWTGAEETVLYAFSCGGEGLNLAAEKTLNGSVLSVKASEEGFTLLLQTKEDVTLVTLDKELNGSANFTAEGAGSVKNEQIYEDGAVFLTDDAVHVLTAAGDRSLTVSGDGFRRLTEDRLLVFSQSGQLQLVSLDGDALKALGAASVKDSLALLVEDPSRMDYDPAAGRLVFPAGQKVYQYLIQDTGELTARGTPINFYDHNEVEQRELRCLLTQTQILIFYKYGVMICNQNLVRQNIMKY